MLVRLPVVVTMMAAFFSMKSLGVVPHSTTPLGCTPSLARLTHISSASMTLGWSKVTFVPASLASSTSLGVVKVCSIQ